MASCSYALMLSHPRCHYALALSCSRGLITGSDRDVSLELDVGYRSESGSPEGLYDRREFILDWGESSRGGEGGRGSPDVAP